MNSSTDNAMREKARVGERRQVSVLFTDMVGYTSIVETLDEEKSVAFVQMIYDRLTSAITEHGGVVRGFAGDSVMAVFGIPLALEDSAHRACRAALSVQAVFKAAADDIEAEFGVRPQMRVGVSSGSVVVAAVEGKDGDLTAVGTTVNLASRIESLAPTGGCLICDATRHRVEWLVDLSFNGEHDIKGVTKRQKLWQLTAIREGATRFDASLARGLSEYIGRDHELKKMAQALKNAKENLCIFDLVSEPGLGKTRLVYEFLKKQISEETLVITGQCAVDSQQTPFFPFLQIIRFAFQIQDDDDAAEITAKLESGLAGWGMDTPENLGLLLNLLGLAPPEGALDGLDGVLIGLRTRDLFPAMLEAQCQIGKVVLRLEDTHWIDSASEELLAKLIEGRTHSNLLIIQTRRPEFVPSWYDNDEVTSITLGPLTESDIVQLAQTRLGVKDLPDALIQQVTERAGGNPLFGEEILSFLVQEDALVIKDGKVQFDAALGASAMPESMASLLTARISGLQAEDRELLQAAAAIGRHFDPVVLSLVVENPSEMGAALRRLQSHDIVFREAGSTDFIFKHALLKDAVYQSLLSGPRSELHLLIAQAMESRGGARRSEIAETLAYHYSLTKRTDLAFTYNALAGAKSLGVFSLDAANQYFASALALYQADPSCCSDENFAAFLADYALCSNISLQINTMMALADDVLPILERIGDSRHRVFFLHHYVSCLIVNGRYLDALKVQKELAEIAARLGDPEAKAYALVSEMCVSCYCGQLSSDVFEEKRIEAETLVQGQGDAYLSNFFLAHVGWNAVSRGRVPEAHASADNMIVVGGATNDPRALGYGTAMKALIALASDDHRAALEISEQALNLSRAEFEIAIASAARCGALVPLEEPKAVEELNVFIDLCNARGWELFKTTPDTMTGVALALDGRIGDGLKHIEGVIARREEDGYLTAANWYRLFLCEVYLEILSGNGDASLSVLFKNIRALTGVLVFGPKRIISLVEKARQHSMFDPEGHHIGRAEMILGILYKIKKKKALAKHHLSEAHRIVSPAGASPILQRIEDAMVGLD
jgi:predicted ATPase/class 3 adenylate cyclase